MGASEDLSKIGLKGTDSESSFNAINRHPRDISENDLASAMASAARPDLLGKLAAISRRTFGFFPSQYTYTLSYPWAARNLDPLPAGAHLLDIGAGLSPLPIFFAEKGHLVDCVDAHPTVRTLPPKPDWNEWGFFDYRRMHANLRSHHRSILDFEPSQKLDAAYAVCSLAHMRCTVREETLNLAREWLRTGSILLLVMDLIPATDFVWNYSGGREVEPPEQHGTTDDVLQQLMSLGFTVTEARAVRQIPNWSRTDLFFVRCDLID